MVEGPLDELLEIVNCPAAAPAIDGSNSTVNVRDWPGFSVTGKVIPETVKSLPVRDADAAVTGAVPLDVSVSDAEAALFTATLPKTRLVVLTSRAGMVAVSCSENDRATPLAKAVTPATWSDVTHDNVETNAALVTPAGMVTEDGTVTAELLLDKLTLCPP